MKTSRDNWFTLVEDEMAQGLSADKAILKVKKEHPELIPKAGQCFEDIVRENFASGLSRTDSVKKAVTNHPALHVDWLRRLPTGQKNTKDLFPR